MPLLMGMTLCWRSVLPQDVYFHKNRTERLQRGLNRLKPYKPASGGINVMLELKKTELEVDVLFRSVVRDAAVQRDAVTELSVVAVFLVFPFSVPTVLSQSSRSATLAEASGSLDKPHGLCQT